MAKKQPDIPRIIRLRRERVENRRGYLELAAKLIAIAAAAYLVFTQVFLFTQVEGSGMFPAAKDGDLLIVFRLQRDYAAKDLVVYTRDGQRRLGRIVARENDVVQMDDGGSLVVNGTTQTGEILYPTYARTGIEYPYRVTEDSVFVLGDYRTQAEDSRDFGPVPMESVQGKVITILRRRGM